MFRRFDVLMFAPDVEEFVTELRNVPQGWFFIGALAGAIGICWAVVWMYRREGRRGASLRALMILAALRCAFLMTMPFILLDAVLVRFVLRRFDSCTVLILAPSPVM